MRRPMWLMAIALVPLVFLQPATVGKASRLLRVPELHAGQQFVYRVRFQVKKVTRAESHIATPLGPEGQDSDTERWISVEIRNVQSTPGGPRVAMRTHLLPAGGTAQTTEEDRVVEFTLLEDGRASELQGFDALSADEQAVWRQWVAQFALGWTFPAKGIKPGEKWKKQEPVVGIPLDKLEWDKQYEYVRNEACPQRGDSGNIAQRGQCAVIVTTTSMKQHGPRDDATPEDYRVHQLKTSGTAQGKIEIITFISLQSGFVERAVEDSAQTLDVLIAKADESNKAHFNIDASSHAEVVLLQ